jgi:acyl-CoA thioester hydrolase
MKLLSTNKIQVRARDIDIFNHVNNSVYLTYMEEARWKWFFACGFQEKFKDGLAIVEARLEFKKPITFPNEVIVETYAHTLGRTSFTVHHKLSITEDPEKICTLADIKIVFFDLKTQKPIPIPDYFRALI